MADPKVEKFNVARLALMFNKHFQQRATDFLFDGIAQQGTTSGNYLHIANVYPTGEMREFVGDAVVHPLEAARFDVPLKPYEHTVGIKRTTLQRGDAITASDFTSAAMDLADSPWANAEKSLTQVLIDNPVDITGATFFNDNSSPGAKVIPGTDIEITNDIDVDVTTAITSADIIEACWGARAQLLKMRNSMNARINEVRGTPSYVVMYGPSLERLVQDAFVTGVATTNDRADLKQMFDFRANPYLPDIDVENDQYIYVFVRQPRYAALAWGETRTPSLGSELDNPAAHSAIRNNMFALQVYADRAFGPASPFSVVRVELDV